MNRGQKGKASCQRFSLESGGVIRSEISFLKEQPTPWYASLSRQRFYYFQIASAWSEQVSPATKGLLLSEFR